MYKTFSRSQLDYCDVIYHQAAKITKEGVVLSNMMNEYRGALAVTGTWKGTSRAKLYDELGWESLSDRRMKQRFVLLYKIINNLTPSYLRDKLPPLRNPFANETSYTYREYRIRTVIQKFLFP